MKKIANLTSIAEIRKFGLTLCIVFALMGLFFMLREHESCLLWAFSVFLLLVTLGKPSLLKPVHAWWMKLAEILSFIMTRAILILLFYILLTPIGIIFRKLGKDFLSQKNNTEKKSYWILCPPEKQMSNRIEKQF